MLIFISVSVMIVFIFVRNQLTFGMAVVLLSYAAEFPYFILEKEAAQRRVNFTDARFSNPPTIPSQSMRSIKTNSIC